MNTAAVFLIEKARIIMVMVGTLDRMSRQVTSQVSVGRIRRPVRDNPTERDRIERRWAAWAVMVNAGMTYRQIADSSGVSVAAVHKGVRKVKARAAAALRRRAERDA